MKNLSGISTQRGLYGYSPREDRFAVGMAMILRKRLKTHISSCGYMDIHTLIEYPTLSKKEIGDKETRFKALMAKEYELVEGTTEVYIVPNQEEVILYLKSIGYYFPSEWSEETRRVVNPRKACALCGKHPVAPLAKDLKGERIVKNFRNKSMEPCDPTEDGVCQSCWVTWSNAQFALKVQSGNVEYAEILKDWQEKTNRFII